MNPIHLFGETINLTTLIPICNSLSISDMASEKSTMVSSVLKAIMQHCDSSEIKLRLDRCLTTDIESWKDENSLDLGHHCIIHDNLEALTLLLTQGYIKLPHEPSTWPYPHLVACLGRITFISLINQHYNYKRVTVILDWDVINKAIKPRINMCVPKLWDVFNKAIKPRINMCVPELTTADKNKKLSPVEVAALFGHVECVRLLLGHLPWLQCSFGFSNKLGSLSNPKMYNPDSYYMIHACYLDSPYALKLLASNSSDHELALEYALRMLAPECVDSILGEMGTDVQEAFHGMNLYHILYAYSNRGPFSDQDDMVKITAILIKHKQNVNAVQPSGTFPLYSLLSRAMPDKNAEEWCSILLACLSLLLQAGADPNVNEIGIEQKIQVPERDRAFGRQHHSSAINCFLHYVPFLKSRIFNTPLVDTVDRYACEILELLLKYGADFNFIGNFNSALFSETQTTQYHFGTALHMMLSTRAQSPLSYPLLSLILQNGLDVDTTGNWYMPGSTFILHYALNVLPFSLWSLPDVTSAITHTGKHVFTSQDLEAFVYIMNCMSQQALVMAYREFLEGVQILRQSAERLGTLQTLERSHLQESTFFAEIVNEYEMMTRQPWSLQHCCSHAVWRACRMHVTNIHDLPIPRPLRNIVLDFIERLCKIDGRFEDN